jgi:hypothetical protein
MAGETGGVAGEAGRGSWRGRLAGEVGGGLAGELGGGGWRGSWRGTGGGLAGENSTHQFF